MQLKILKVLRFDAVHLIPFSQIVQIVKCKNTREISIELVNRNSISTRYNASIEHLDAVFNALITWLESESTNMHTLGEPSHEI